MTESNLTIVTMHCQHCGQQIQGSYPIVCACGFKTRMAIYPVAVVLIPVYEQAYPLPGIILGRRAIEPGKGQWGLTGGFVNPGETTRQAAVREVEEELGLSIDAERLTNFGEAVSEHLDRLLTFYLSAPLMLSEYKYCQIDPKEVIELKIAHHAESLAFQSHTTMLATYFSRR